MPSGSGVSDPSPAESPWRTAQEYIRAGRLDAAEAIYRAIAQSQPGQAAAWYGLSDVALRQGQFRDAVEHTRSAAAALRKHGQWDLLTRVAMRLLSLGEYRLAAESILAAPRDHREVLPNCTGLAQYLGMCERHSDALELLDFAASRLPPDPLRSYARATALRHLGRIDEATAEYEDCLAQAPGHIAARWALAYHQPGNGPDARVPALRKLRDRVPPDSPAAPFLYYALFKELDATGDHAAAWDALQAGAAAKRRQVQYDASSEARRYSSLVQSCDRGFVQRTSSVRADCTPVFIVGLPRTGTTLLERILGNHAGVHSAGELGDFHMQLCWEADVIAPEMLDARLLQRCADIDFTRLGEGYLQRTAWRAQGAAFLIDKFPANFAYAGLIHKALPQAKIICLRRNPMDSCFSNLKELFSGNAYPHSYDLAEMAGHFGRFRQLLDHWQQVMPEAIHVVDYERLVDDPRAVARDCATFCGLAFDPRSIDIQANTAPVATASSSQVRERIHRRNLAGWQRYAGPLEQLRQSLAPWMNEAAR